jgi:tetratricopeptide (TPR) repeat protein
MMLAGCQPSRPAALIVATRPTTSPAELSKLAEARDLFYQSVAGDRAALPKAQRLLDELGGGNAADPQIVAYTGAATLLQASRSANIFEKSALGHKGMDMEDTAVAEAPNDLEVRFLQGVTFYQLPPFLGRRQKAIDDLTEVARVAEAAAKSGKLDPRAAAADLVYYGKIREENYDAPGAIAAWRSAIQIDPNGQAARDARKHLAEHNVDS